MTSVKNGAGVFYRHFTSDPAVVASVLAALGDNFKAFALSDEAISNIEIVLSEVINNINEHAYQGAVDGPVEIQAVVMDGQILCQLVDSGVEMPGGQIPPCTRVDLTGPLAQLPEGGFGWCLIRDLAHDLKYDRKNGENRISFRVTIDGTITR